MTNQNGTHGLSRLSDYKQIQAIYKQNLEAHLATVATDSAAVLGLLEALKVYFEACKNLASGLSDSEGSGAKLQGGLELRGIVAESAIQALIIFALNTINLIEGTNAQEKR